MAEDGVVFAFDGDAVTAYPGVGEAERAFGPADVVREGEPALVFFSAAGTLMEVGRHEYGHIRLSPGEDRREALLARLTQAFTDADLAVPEAADDPAAYGQVLLREQAVVNERNLNRALQPVLAELFCFYPDLLEVAPAPFGVYLKDSYGRGYGIDYRSVSDDVVWTTYWVADVVQDAAIEALWALHETPTWPECPLHPGTHPLNLEVLEDRQEVVWICPTSKTRIASIGDLTPNDGDWPRDRS